MLALFKNSTSVYYRCGHVCVKHQAVLDMDHIQLCDQLRGHAEIASHLKTLRSGQLCDLEPTLRQRVLEDFELLQLDL